MNDKRTLEARYQAFCGSRADLTGMGPAYMRNRQNRYTNVFFHAPLMGKITIDKPGNVW